MRLSVTDRCNLRCKYCMPPEGIKKVDMSMILQNEEIEAVCEAAIGLGINKFKITGGEPLVRYNVADLVRRIKGLPGTEQVTMTTNGQEMARYIDDLCDAGIDAFNISLDTLRKDRYTEITRLGDLQKTLDAIDMSIERGIRTKLNCLVQRAFNEDEIIDLAEFAMGKGMDVRFIELMPIGIADAEKGYSSMETMARLKEAYPELEEDEEKHGNGPAVYYKVPGKKGAIGIISSVHGKFCESCNRLRLTSMGYIKPCLCYDETVFIRPYVTEGKEALTAALRDAILSKPAHHCFEYGSNVDHHSMSEIGG